MTTLQVLAIPHMGSVENASLVEWTVAEGDHVAMDQTVCEVETDKVATDIPAPNEGIVARLLAKPGDELRTGAPIALLAPPGTDKAEIEQALKAHDTAAADDTDETPPSSAQLAPPMVTNRSSASADASPTSVDFPRPSPLVRRLAQKEGVDLATVHGTGPGGRVMRADLMAVLEQIAAHQTADATPSPRSAPDRAVPPERSASPSTPHKAVRHSGARRAIARNLTESVRTAPQLTADVEVDMSAVMAARGRINADRVHGGEQKLSLLAFIARAACSVLRTHGELNATYTDDALLCWTPVHLGLAVDADGTLVVPVIRDADRMTVDGLGDAMAELIAKARDGRLEAADMAGGTFTLSNPGSVGPVLRAEAILTPGQVGLLGTPSIRREPTVLQGADGEEYIGIRPLLRPSLTFDHRAVDGAEAVRYLADLKRALETWGDEAYR